MLRGFGWLSVVARVVKEIAKPVRPPLVYCLICGPPVKNYWLVKYKVYGCDNGHNFNVDKTWKPGVDLGPPARDYPGDI